MLPVHSFSTKQANRWLERDIDDSELAQFSLSMEATKVRWRCAHDSYLINLASPDDTLRARSIDSFRGELRRCHVLGLDALVSHPGNFMDDRNNGLTRNRRVDCGSARAGNAVQRHCSWSSPQVRARSLARTFEEMAALIDRVPRRSEIARLECVSIRRTYGPPAMTSQNDYDAVMQRFDDVIGLHRTGMPPSQRLEGCTWIASRSTRTHRRGADWCGRVP